MEDLLLEFEESVKTNNKQSILLLLNKGVNINLNKDWAIRWTSKFGNVEMLDFLIENGAKFNHKNDVFEYLIQYRSNEIELIKKCIKADLAIIVSNERNTFRASEKEIIMMIELCKEFNVDITQKEYFVKRLANLNNSEITKKLINNGANIDMEEGYILKNYIEKENIEMVRFLMEKKAKIDWEITDPLINVAAKTGNLEIVQLLIDAGANFKMIKGTSKKSKIVKPWAKKYQQKLELKNKLIEELEEKSTLVNKMKL